MHGKNESTLPMQNMLSLHTFGRAYTFAYFHFCGQELLGPRLCIFIHWLWWCCAEQAVLATKGWPDLNGIYPQKSKWVFTASSECYCRL